MMSLNNVGDIRLHPGLPEESQEWLVGFQEPIAHQKTGKRDIGVSKKMGANTGDPRT